MNISLCIIDRDTYFAKAFMRTVALDHAGFSVRARSACGPDCLKDVDACVDFGQDEAEGLAHCGKAFQPSCGKYAGVESVLREVRAFVSGHGNGGAGIPVSENHFDYRVGAQQLGQGVLVCVYACAGGIGASTAAIGIGRELARYRGERVLYLSLEDSEDPGLFPPGVHAQRAEELLFRYLRSLRMGCARDAAADLFCAAPGCDEYGLFRLAPDDGLCSLAGLSPQELYDFLLRFVDALKLTRVVLDFGTRLYFLKEFAAMTENGEALFIEATASDEEGSRKRKVILDAEDHAIAASFPYCEEDVRKFERYTDIGLANAFGLAVKELCDRITGESL